MGIFPSVFKNRFNRELTLDYKINLISVIFYLNQKLRAFEKLPTSGTKSGFFR